MSFLRFEAWSDKETYSKEDDAYDLAFPSFDFRSVRIARQVVWALGADFEDGNIAVIATDVEVEEGQDLGSVELELGRTVTNLEFEGYLPSLDTVASFDPAERTLRELVEGSSRATE